jgi:endonuclease/exonuclease/phosphatase family metal-dependent hydrolase
MRVRYVTINLKGVGAGWFERRFDVLVRGLSALAPDVVAFQEATVRYGPSSVYNQAAAIGAAIGLPVTGFSPYGNPIEVMAADHGGVALAARWPIVAIQGRRLPPGPRPPDARTALLATLAAPGGLLHVGTSHLSWRPEEAETRLMQMGLLLEHYARSGWCEGDARAVLVGDFNATEGEPAIALAAERLRDAFRAKHPDAPGHTWLRANPLTGGTWDMPDRRLDYVFCAPTATVLDAAVVLDRPDPGYASDHFGVLAELEWPDE